MSSSPPPEIQGDPDGLAALGGAVGSAADRVGAIQSQLMLQGLESWIGPGGESYRAKLSDFHPHLGTVGQSLGSIAGRVATYSGTLREYQGQARNLNQQIDDTQTQIDTKQGTHSQYSENVAQARARANASAGSPSHHQDQSLLDDAVGLLHGVEHEIDGLVNDLETFISQAWDNFNKWTDEVGTVASEVLHETEVVGAVLVGDAAKFIGSVSSDAQALIRDAETGAQVLWHDTSQVVSDVGQWAASELDKHYALIRDVLTITSSALGAASLLALGIPVVGGLVSSGLSVAGTAADGATLGLDEFEAGRGNANSATAKKDLGGDELSLVTDAIGIIPYGKVAGKAIKFVVKADKVDKAVSEGGKLAHVIDDAKAVAKNVKSAADSVKSSVDKLASPLTRRVEKLSVPAEKFVGKLGKDAQQRLIDHVGPNVVHKLEKLAPDRVSVPKAVVKTVEHETVEHVIEPRVEHSLDGSSPSTPHKIGVDILVHGAEGAVP